MVFKAIYRDRVRGKSFTTLTTTLEPINKKRFKEFTKEKRKNVYVWGNGRTSWGIKADVNHFSKGTFSSTYKHLIKVKKGTMLKVEHCDCLF